MDTEIKKIKKAKRVRYRCPKCKEEFELFKAPHGMTECGTCGAIFEKCEEYVPEDYK